MKIRVHSWLNFLKRFPLLKRASKAMASSLPQILRRGNIARAIPGSEPSDKLRLSAAWEIAERTKLRKEAEAANVVIELKPCQSVAGYALRLTR